MEVVFTPVFAIPDERASQAGQGPVLMLDSSLGRLRLTVEGGELTWGFRRGETGSVGAFPAAEVADALVARRMSDPLLATVQAVELEALLTTALTPHRGLLMLWPAKGEFSESMPKTSYWATAERLEGDLTVGFTSHGVELLS